MKQLENTWSISSEARCLFVCASVQNQEVVLNHAYDVFGRAPAMEKEDLGEECLKLELQFTEETYTS